MTYEFQGTLFRNSASMHDAIAYEWITAGGRNPPDDIAKSLSGATDATLANEAIAAWDLLGTDGDGARIMTDFERAELIDAFARFRKSFE